MTEPDEGNWRVRMGCSLLQFTPMSPERRQAFDKEAEREAKAAEFEEEQRRTAALERRQDLEFRGVVPVSVAERLQVVGWAQDRADAAEARRLKAGDEQRGEEREPRLDKYQMLADAREREAAKETTAATQADLAKVAGKLGSLTSAINLLKRRRSAEQDYHEPREAVARSSGYITRGPY